jgi:hypothetical protein
MSEMSEFGIPPKLFLYPHIRETLGKKPFSLISLINGAQMTVTERASRYVAALPAAISGARGHDAHFRVACVLINGFALPDEHAWPILREYNARCLPPWSEHELRHKLAEAYKVQHRDPRGHLLGRSDESKRPAPPRLIGRISLPEPESEVSTSSVPNDNEARRVAGELVKLHRGSAFTGRLLCKGLTTGRNEP